MRSTSVKSCLKFITQKKSWQNCLFLKQHFSHEISRNVLKKVVILPGHFGYDRVSRAIVRVSVYASSFWLYSAVVFVNGSLAWKLFIQISMLFWPDFIDLNREISVVRYIWKVLTAYLTVCQKLFVPIFWSFFVSSCNLHNV